MRSSDTIGPEILKALGIETKNARLAEIRMKAGQPIMVNVEYTVYTDALTPERNTKISTEAKRFELIEKE